MQTLRLFCRPSLRPEACALKSTDRVAILTVVGLLSACGTIPQGDVVAPREAPREASQPSERSAPETRRSPINEPPGALFADVTQATVTTTTCVPGWTATVRPSPSFT